MRHAGVSLDQLRAGDVDEAMRRLFWKQIVRVRDAFAQGQSLTRDLPRWQRRVFKQWWLGGQEPPLQAFIQPWAGSQGRLLARLAGHKGSWQLPLVDELTRAFFLTGRLVHLPDDLARDRLFIPLDEMRHAGVSLDQLRAGDVDEAMRRLFWKQIVRVRDAFAQGQSLARDLPRWQRRVFKQWWLGGLELVNEIERRQYDVWSQPLMVSSVQRFRVRMQALAGRTSFR